MVHRRVVAPIILLLASGPIGLLFRNGSTIEQSVYAAPQGGGRCTLSGVVLGPDDKPVAHASVSYQSSSGRAPHVVQTDRNGRFYISKLKSDNYDIRASASGVFSEWEKNITLRPGRSREITLRLIYAKEMPNPKSASQSKH